jgi:hypothetical protein
MLKNIILLLWRNLLPFSLPPATRATPIKRMMKQPSHCHHVHGGEGRSFGPNHPAECATEQAKSSIWTLDVTPAR